MTEAIVSRERGTSPPVAINCPQCRKLWGRADENVLRPGARLQVQCDRCRAFLTYEGPIKETAAEV